MSSDTMRAIGSFQLPPPRPHPSNDVIATASYPTGGLSAATNDTNPSYTGNGKSF